MIRVVNVNGIASPYREWDDSMDHDDCPLHSPTSKHPYKRRLVITRA